eukprot:gene111-346_t
MPAGGSNALAKARQKQERAADVGDRDYDEQAAKRRQRTLAKKIGRDLCLYALFLAAFTVWTLSGHSSESALLVDRVKTMVAAENSRTPLNEVNSVETFYGYVDSFLDIITRNSTAGKGPASPWLDRQLARVNGKVAMLPLDASNRLFGTAKLRQQRVKGAGIVNGVPDCKQGVIFERWRGQCYRAWSPATMSKDAYGPGGKFVYSNPLPTEMPNVDLVSGKLQTYEPGGFEMPISTNSTLGTDGMTTAQRVAADYKASGFIDKQTRAVFIDFT